MDDRKSRTAANYWHLNLKYTYDTQLALFAPGAVNLLATIVETTRNAFSPLFLSWECGNREMIQLTQDRDMPAVSIAGARDVFPAVTKSRAVIQDRKDQDEQLQPLGPNLNKTLPFGYPETPR